MSLVKEQFDHHSDLINDRVAPWNFDLLIPSFEQPITIIGKVEHNLGREALKLQLDVSLEKQRAFNSDNWKHLPPPDVSTRVEMPAPWMNAPAPDPSTKVENLAPPVELRDFPARIHGRHRASGPVDLPISLIHSNKEA
jgi:hypothetical protein